MLFINMSVLLKTGKRAVQTKKRLFLIARLLIENDLDAHSSILKIYRLLKRIKFSKVMIVMFLIL